MSPRPFRLRRINNPPMISGMKPYGGKIKQKATDTVFLLLEEYEAVRLCDHEMLNHFQASSLMNVSRPTLTRIYARARKKVAEAIVLGKQIIIEGGKIYFDSEWFECQDCGCYFNNPEKQNSIGICPLCGAENIKYFRHDPVEEDESHSRCSDLCICPVCGKENPHHFGHPCKDEVCPECGFRMVRKGL
jgi:predicted DNA-binding protein (UPF0251 family)